MSTQSFVTRSRSASALTPLRLGMWLGSYALVLLSVALAIPLRIPEVLQIAGFWRVSPARFFGWIAHAPASAPLYPIAELPLALVGGPSRLAARVLSLAFAVGACYLFLRLAKRIPVDRPYTALLVFMLLPLHFELSFQARPFEAALFLVVLATDYFFRLISRPSVNAALFYAGCLTLCVYTDRYSLLPAIGYLFFLLRFANRAQERRALWYALAATVTPVLLFLPYGVWAYPQVHTNWLDGRPSLASGFVPLVAVRSLAAERWASYLLCVLLSIGFIAGASASFVARGGTVSKRIRLFVLAGGVFFAIVIAVALDMFLGEKFNSSQLLWTTPALVILLFAALEWLAKRPGFAPVAIAVTILLVAISAAADAEYLISPPDSAQREDLQAIAALTPGQLKSSDSCVVFVSERYSKALFLVFEPELARRECLNFFHSRIVLASHPYVTSEQQYDAESFFRGLNMVETNRLTAGGGQLVVVQQQAR